METIFHNLYLGKTNQIPIDENGEDFAVVICMEKDKEITPNLEQHPDMRFLIIILEKTQSERKSNPQRIKAEWARFSNLELELEHITDNMNRIRKHYRKIFQEMEAEEIHFNAAVMGFNKTSKLESCEARITTLGVCKKAKWNFWS